MRSLGDEFKVAHLKQLFPSLELFEADLLKEGSFDEAFKGEPDSLSPIYFFTIAECSCRMRLCAPHCVSLLD